MPALPIAYVPPDGVVELKDGGFYTAVYGKNEAGQRVMLAHYWRTPETFFYFHRLNEAAAAEWQRMQAEAVIARLPKGKLERA